jgi:hypothetical protein
LTDFLDEKRKEIQNRLRELKPLVEEYHRLEAAASALDGVGGSAPARRGPGRPRGSTTRRRGATTAKRGRRRGGGNTRATQALDLVKANPGITIPELAQRMGIKQNYLYRVLPGLQSDGLVKKDGKGWRPA